MPISSQPGLLSFKGGTPLFSLPRSGGSSGASVGSPPVSLCGDAYRTGGPYKKNSAKKSKTHFENGSPCLEIYTKKSELILVSGKDADLVLSHTWHVNKDGYAQAMIDGKPWVMHRLVVGEILQGQEVDHRDGKKLNNTRTNLRVASKGQNAANRGKSGSSKNQFKGVKFVKKANRWIARVTKDGKRHESGYHKTAIGAARAYDVMAKELHGEFAKLNF